MQDEAYGVSAGGVKIAAKIPLAGMRRLIAEHMLASHQSVPAVTIFGEFDMGALILLKRSVLDGRALAAGAKISYTHLFMKALGVALREHPLLNATIAGDHIQVLDEINLGMAVALPEGTLVVPVVRDVDRKTVIEIAQEAAQLADAARRGALGIKQVRGATFTLTNVGMISGTRWQTPLVSQSQCAILAFGEIRQTPVVRAGQIAIGDVVSASLTFDHRILSGVPASEFIAALSNLLAEPQSWAT